MARAEAARIERTEQVLENELAWLQAAETLQLAAPEPELARRHLLEFIRWGHPSYRVGWFHRELCAELERFSRDVTAGRSPRLLIAAPPRHGKSEIVSRRWPVWHLGQNPTHELVVASYGQDLANDMSRDARAIRDEVVDWWPHLEPGDRDGVEHWRTLGGGSYMAVGAGGPLTGRGAHALVIDDPLKNYEEASSQVVRESRWHWYKTTAYTRLAPGGGVLAMATRWHHDDPSGRMLEQLRVGDEEWRVVCYPAIAEEDERFRKRGEALHPERYPLAQLERIRIILGSRAFAALYQQRPTPESGGLFQRAWLARRVLHDVQRPPKRYTEIVISVDAAFKETDDSDFISMLVWGRYDWTEYHLLDEIHDRMAYVGTRQALRDLVVKWRPDAVLVEEKANGAAIIDDLRTEIPALVPFIPDKYGNKKARAELATPIFEAGQVALASADWTGDYVEEMVAFPAGTNDDRVDATSQVFLWWGERRRAGQGDEALMAGMEGYLVSLGG